MNNLESCPNMERCIDQGFALIKIYTNSNKPAIDKIKFENLPPLEMARKQELCKKFSKDGMGLEYRNKICTNMRPELKLTNYLAKNKEKLQILQESRRTQDKALPRTRNTDISHYRSKSELSKYGKSQSKITSMVNELPLLAPRILKRHISPSKKPNMNPKIIENKIAKEVTNGETLIIEQNMENIDDNKGNKVNLQNKGKKSKSVPLSPREIVEKAKSSFDYNISSRNIINENKEYIKRFSNSALSIHNDYKNLSNIQTSCKSVDLNKHLSSLPKHLEDYLKLHEGRTTRLYNEVERIKEFRIESLRHYQYKFRKIKTRQKRIIEYSEEHNDPPCIIDLLLQINYHDNAHEVQHNQNHCTNTNTNTNDARVKFNSMTFDMFN